MLIFPDKKLTFIATPKTGTTAIEMALRPRAEIIFGKGRKHLGPQKYAEKVAPFLFETFGISTETVAVMRAPEDQIRSWYKYRSRPEMKGHERSTQGMSFDNFVHEAISKDPAPCAKIGSQFTFLTDRTGTVLVDHLFAYEDQPALLAFLAKRLETPVVLKQKNVSPEVPATLSQQVAADLRKSRAQEFDLYDRLIAAGGYLSRD